MDVGRRRQRRPHEVDRWVWFCEKCDNKLYEAAPRSGEGSNGKQIFQSKKPHKRFKADLALGTCERCGEILQLED